MSVRLWQIPWSKILTLPLKSAKKKRETPIRSSCRKWSDIRHAWFFQTNLDTLKLEGEMHCALLYSWVCSRGHLYTAMIFLIIHSVCVRDAPECQGRLPRCLCSGRRARLQKLHCRPLVCIVYTVYIQNRPKIEMKEKNYNVLEVDLLYCYYNSLFTPCRRVCCVSFRFSTKALSKLRVS